MEAAVERTVTLSGESSVSDVSIPVVVCDYMKDGLVDYRDVALFVDFVDKPEAYNVYADVMKDELVDYRDVALFVDFIDVPVAYTALSLD